MNSGMRIAMTSLAVLWIMTGLAFGGLSLTGATPTPRVATLPEWLCAPPTAHGPVECGHRQ
jgi:hypothetical protein